MKAKTLMGGLSSGTSLRRLWALGAFVALLAGCASSMPSDRDAVAVTAVNYTGREIAGFLFIDPADDEKVAGGPPVTPYSGAGAMCCYALPRQWRPGIQVKLRYRWYHPNPREERPQFVTAELPPYPTDEPGVLWALFYEDGSVEVLASAVDPGHPKWPGRLKHWPVPSREYRLKRWQIRYDQVASLVPYYREMMTGLPPSKLHKEWDLRAKYEPHSLKGYTGFDDPAFRDLMRKEGAKALERALEDLKTLESIKP